MQYTQIIFLVVIVGSFYFLLIRPQQQQAKKQAQLVASLEPGTEIMTIGGLYATVVSVDGDRVRVVVADGSEMEFAKRAVSALVKPTADDTDDEADSEEADAEDEAQWDGEPPVDGAFRAPVDAEPAAKDDAQDA